MVEDLGKDLKKLQEEVGSLKQKSKKLKKSENSKKSKHNKKSSKKQKFLTKPKAKGPTSISAKKTLKSFAHSTGPLVREVEEKEVVQDNRSQFFTSEFRKEERSANKWLG